MADISKDFTVQYKIEVDSQSALNSIQAFVKGVNKMTNLTASMDKITKKIGKINAAFISLNKSQPNMRISTDQAEKNLDRVLAKLKEIQALSKTALNGNVSGGSSGSNNNSSGNSGGSSNSTSSGSGGGGSSSGRRRTSASGGANNPANKNLSYKIFGPSMIDSGGVTAVNMAKGFGVAYGITGLMQAVNTALQEAVDYDNISKTTQNILSTNDKAPAFMSRFNEMNHVMRRVGVETKFTAPQVAEAGKFLAMAGMNIDQITKSISSISDMALVGDTDLGLTADVVTNIMTGYGIKADKLGRVADIMTMTSTNANTTIIEMAEAFKYSASLLRNSGIQFEEAAAAMGILGDAGIKGSQAGTTLRTLMVNLINPTKKQRNMWNKFGVNTLDANGDVRPMPEIFAELKQKKASTTDLAVMFHKTALQGAMSLMNNVGKWNEVIAKNFMSESLAKKLAEEKQNTILGLWDQLTSAFTEDGIVQFEYLQDWIKGVLKGVTNFLQSPEAMEGFREIVDIVKVGMNGLKESAQAALAIYEAFKPLIQMYIRFQAWLMPIMVVGRSLKALGNLWGGLIKFASGIKTLFLTVKTLTAIQTSINALHAATAATDGAAVAGGAVGATRGGRVMGALAGFLGFGGLGGALGLGIAAGAVAVGASIYGLIKWKQAVDESIKSTREWQDEIRTINGIDIKSHASDMTKYLEIVQSGQQNANKQLSTYIQLRREAAGLDAKLGQQGTETPYKQSHEQEYNNLDFYVSKRVDFYDGLRKKYHQMFDIIPRDYTRQLLPYNPWDSPSGKTMNDMLGWGELIKQGISEDSNSKRSEFGEKYLNKILKSANLEDYANVIGSIKNDIKSLSSNIKYKNISFEEWGNLSEGQHQLTDKFIGALQMSLSKDFSPKGKFYDTIAGYRQILGLMQGKKEVPQNLMQDFLYKSGLPFLDPRLGAIFSPQWLKNMGYDTNKPQGHKWGGTQYDSRTGKMVPVGAEDAMKNFLLFLNDLTQKLNTLNPTIASLFQGWKEHPIWSLAGAGVTVTGNKQGQRRLNPKTKKWEKWNETSLAGDGSGGIWTETTGGGGGGSVGGNSYESDPYKNHYKNGNAAPKQIIVKIGNLMKVDKIDMADPEKREAAVNSVKRELADALLGVVADFDISMG